MAGASAEAPATTAFGSVRCVTASSATDLWDQFPRLFVHGTVDSARAVAPFLERRTLQAGETLLERGGASNALFLVWSGRLGVHVDVEGRRLDFGVVAPGGWVGELGFITAGPASADVRAIGRVKLLELSAAAFEQLGREDPGAAKVVLHALCRDLSDRLRHTGEAVAKVGELTLSPVVAAQEGRLRRAWSALLRHR